MQVVHTDDINIYYLCLFQCTVLKSCGEECVIAVKANTALDK